MRVAKKKKKKEIEEGKKMELALAFLVVIPKHTRTCIFGLSKPANQKSGYPLI
jgi:hypothetical protein